MLIKLPVHVSQFTLKFPHYQPSGKRLLNLQKRITDNLAKCRAAIFMVDNISLLEELDEKMNSIHAVLMQAASHLNKYLS